MPASLHHAAADKPETRIFDYQGSRIAVCSEGCEWVFKNWPAAYGGRKRSGACTTAGTSPRHRQARTTPGSGRTLVGQPGIGLKRMWTIDDIRRLNYEVKDPLQS